MKKVFVVFCLALSPLLCFSEGCLSADLFLALDHSSLTKFAVADNGGATQEVAPPANRNLFTASRDLKWELSGLLAGIGYLGIKEWDWGSASFSLNNEGWFEMDSGNGGADKLGHLYSSYVIDEFLTHRLYQKSGDMSYSARSGAFYSFGLMFVVELFDGFSSDHGFSYEDLIMNTTGIGFSYLKNTVPSLAEKLDLRIEYHPSEANEGFHPVTDYSGMKYSVVTKLAGFNSLENTPLKYLELQLGYFVRGFKEGDEVQFKDKSSEIYFGLGADLQELVFKPIMKRWDSKVVKWSNTLFRYYQMPGIYKSTTLNERAEPIN